MSILVDTSVWVQHFRQSNPHMTDLLLADQVLCHPLITLELACGTPPAPRQQTLAAIASLNHCLQATFDEASALIENEKLYGHGCGVVDLLLLASVMITPGAKLWSLDKRLEGLAKRFSVAFSPAPH
jgi:predicted nucleic acid-binding protein